MALESYNLKDKIDAQRILLNLLNHVYSLNPRLLFLLDIYRNHFRTQNPNKIPYKVKKYLRRLPDFVKKKEREKNCVISGVQGGLRHETKIGRRANAKPRDSNIKPTLRVR